MIAPVLVALALAQAPVLTLNQALQDAKENNLDLKAAQARLQQAKQLSWKVWSAYLPQISVGGSFARNNTEAKIALPTGYYVRDFFTPQGPSFDPSQAPSPANPPGAQTNFGLFPSGLAEVTIQALNQLGAQAQLTQALIVPALWPAISNAYTAQRVAEFGTETAKREILFGVAQVYYGAAGLKAAIAAQERLLKLAQEREKDADLRFRAGASLKLGLVRAQIDRSRAEADLKRAQNAYLGARQSLATLLNRMPDFDIAQPPSPELPPDPSQLQQHVLRARPDVSAARASEELANGARRGSWFKYFPSVVGTGTFRAANVTGFTGEYTSWALGIGLNWTLFDGGLREAELRENGAKVVEAEAARHASENRAKDELARALLDLDSARASRSKAEEQLKLARENFQLAKVNLMAGAASDLDVQEASTSLSGAETASVAEALNADLAALRVLKAGGAFNP